MVYQPSNRVQSAINGGRQKGAGFSNTIFSATVGGATATTKTTFASTLSPNLIYKSPEAASNPSLFQTMRLEQQLAKMKEYEEEV